MAFETIAAAVSTMTKSPPDIAGFSKMCSASLATKPSARMASSSTSADGRKAPRVLSCTLQVLLPRRGTFNRLGRDNPDRQHHGCGRAHAEAALDCQAAAVEGSEPFHHGQAETRPLVTSLVALIGLNERRAEPRQVVGRDADAGIGNGDAHHPIPSRDGNFHRAAATGELDRVREKVEKHLLDGAPVGGNFL